MRGTVCRVEDYVLLTVVRLSREVAQTSVWMGLALVLGLFWVTGAFQFVSGRTGVQPPPRPAASVVASAQAKRNAGLGKSFKGPLGLQLYSLRNEFKREGVAVTLARVRNMGFRYLELSGSYDLTPQAFKEELNRAELKPVSMMTSYDRLRDKIGDVIAEAKIYGVSYVGTGWIPHKLPFTEATAREAAMVFNQAGAACKAAGLKFFYHLHGYEFQPTAEGTLFDLMAKECKPALVSFELDVFWATHAGQDSAQLLQKHPQRFLLAHLKDLRRDIAGNLSGSSPDDTSVVLGTGRVKWPEVLKAAKQARVQWYFIEAEEPDALANIPQSLTYLEGLKF